MNKIFLFLAFTFLIVSTANAQNLTVRDIMREPSIAGMRPESEQLAPNGEFVVYSWNAAGVEPRNLYFVSTNGGEPRILVNAEQNYEPRTAPPESKLNYGLIVRDDFVKAREKNLGGVDISPDSKRILFSQNSDIYVLDLADQTAKPRRITRTQGFEGGARWLNDDSILYSSGGNYFVLNLKETSLVQVTKEANPQGFVSVFNASATKDGKMLAYVVSDGSRQKSLFVPNYLDEFVQANSTRRGFADQKIYAAPTDGSREKAFEINLPKADGAGYIRGIDWAADNRSLVVDRLDKDLKRRQLFYVYHVGGKDELTILVTEETDEKWVAPLSGIVEPNPKDASQILFGSEKDGYNHLYLATLERTAKSPNPAGEIRQENTSDAGFTSKVEIKKLTFGPWEVNWAKWHPRPEEYITPFNKDRQQILFTSTKKGTEFKDLSIVSIVEGKPTTVDKMYSKESLGIIESPQIADEADEKSPFILYRFSKWNQPTELFAARFCITCPVYKNANTAIKSTSTFKDTDSLIKLTSTTPESFKQIKWNAPQFVDIPARDGKPIKSKIYTPADFDKSKKYPMVIFVHGAGYLQNTINGWNNYYREFMFNELLTQKGYVVLDVDYRGSAGYGRDWRTDVYDFLGGKDYEDELDAIDYAVKNYAVDAKKIGVYGGSYGGFMAEMLAFRTDKITCAAALRPVADWKNYYYSSPVYTAERLGFPDKNPEGYKRSSPISYAENLNKPLLILHGLVDDNVPAQDSMQLVEKLIRLEKTDYFSEMIYPSESHGFVRPTSWTDEYTRIFNFFEKNLK